MTKVLKLVNGEDAFATVTLISGPEAGNGWRILNWQTMAGEMITGRPDVPVVERMELICDAEDHDNLAAHFQALDEMRRWAASYKPDPTVSRAGDREGVYLHAKMDGETGERRALVNAIRVMRWTTQQISDAGGSSESRVGVRLELEREPWWEDTTARGFPSVAEASGACLVYDYTDSGAHLVAGDMPARIRNLNIRSDATGARVGRLWMGLRSQDKHNDVDDFEDIWECEDTDGDLGTDAARATDATASPTGGGNTKVTITPGTATWAKRLTLMIEDFTNHWDDNLGLFLWLLRYKLSAGSSTWDAQLRFGYSGMADGDFKRGPVVELANFSWDYLEMAAQLMPVSGRYYLGLNQGKCAVQIWARRTSGSANLDLDCLIPLPVDEGWLKITGIDLPAGSEASLNVTERPDGTITVFQIGAVGIEILGRPASWAFRLPPGDGRMYIVYAGPTDSDITTGGITMTGAGAGYGYIERWANLRGAD